MSYQEERHIKYNIDLKTTDNHGLFYSYAKNVPAPIVFTHYSNKGGSTPLISCDQSSKVCRILIFSSGKSVFQLGNTLYAPMHGDALLIKDHTEYIAYFYPDSCPDYYEMSFPIAFFECLSAPNPFHTLFYEPDKRKSNLIHLNHTECDNILHKLHHQIMSIS